MRRETLPSERIGSHEWRQDWIVNNILGIFSGVHRQGLTAQDLMEFVMNENPNKNIYII